MGLTNVKEVMAEVVNRENIRDPFHEGPPIFLSSLDHHTDLWFYWQFPVVGSDLATLISPRSALCTLADKK